MEHSISLIFINRNWKHQKLYQECLLCYWKIKIPNCWHKKWQFFPNLPFKNLVSGIVIFFTASCLWWWEIVICWSFSQVPSASDAVPGSYWSLPFTQITQLTAQWWKLRKGLHKTNYLKGSHFWDDKGEHKQTSVIERSPGGWLDRKWGDWLWII